MNSFGGSNCFVLVGPYSSSQAIEKAECDPPMITMVQGFCALTFLISETSCLKPRSRKSSSDVYTFCTLGLISSFLS